MSDTIKKTRTPRAVSAMTTLQDQRIKLANAVDKAKTKVQAAQGDLTTAKNNLSEFEASLASLTGAKPGADAPND